MPRTLIIGLAILLAGVSASLLLALWVGPWQAERSAHDLSSIRTSVTSLLEELRETLKAAPDSELAGTKQLLQRADLLNSQTASQLGGIRGIVQRVPQRVPSGPFENGGFSWNKDETLRDLEGLRQALAEARTLTSEASGRLERLSLAMLDLNRRVTDVDARVNTEIKRMDSQLSSLSEPQKILASIWLPISLAITTVVGGVSTMWLGWRKDRREAEDLRIKLHASEPSPETAPQGGNATQQAFAADTASRRG